jgi:hypothetical protein
VGGIPRRTKICATLEARTFGDGAQDARPAIQRAIDACPLGEVVQLGRGTFAIVEDIVYLHKGVTLRGAGATATTLARTNGARPGTYIPGTAKPVLIVGAARWGKGGKAYDVAEDAAKGATSVRLAAAPPGGFARGQLVLVDEHAGAGWQPDPEGRGRVWAAPDGRVTYQRHDPPQPTDDPWPQASAWFSRPERPTAEVKEVGRWDPSTRTLTFTTPFHIDYRRSHAAQVFAYDDAFVRDAGIEDLRLQGGDDGQLRFERTAYSWAARVESTAFLGEGIAVNHSFRAEIRDSYVHGPVWHEPGGGSYNLSLGNGSAEILLENDISVDANKVIVARAAGAGSVVAYSYLDDGHIGSNPSWIEVGLNASHMAGPHHVLFEGNWAFNADSDHTHGSSVLHTFFRNHLSCARRSYPDAAPPPSLVEKVVNKLRRKKSGGAGPLRCAGLQAYSYGMSFVGNVLGEPGVVRGWAYENGTLAGSAIWKLGWDGWPPYPTDSRVAESTLRHGNFDWATGEVRWDPRIAARTLPPSLYRATKPEFFGALPWPWVDPEGATTKVHVLPAKARYDAGTPFAPP